jgi:hypothetical protein
MLLLNDPAALSQLHFEVWTSPAARARWTAPACGATGKEKRS